MRRSAALACACAAFLLLPLLSHPANAASMDASGNFFTVHAGTPMHGAARDSAGNGLEMLVSAPFAARGADAQGNHWSPWLSSSAVLTVFPLGPLVEIQPEGGSATFAVGVFGAVGAVSYQWYRIHEDQSMTLIPGANLAVLTLEPIEADDEGRYWCEVSDSVQVAANAPNFTLVLGAPMPGPALPGLLLMAALIAAAGAAAFRRH
jgi:hypothetical protein